MEETDEVLKIVKSNRESLSDSDYTKILEYIEKQRLIKKDDSSKKKKSIIKEYYPYIEMLMDILKDYFGG